LSWRFTSSGPASPVSTVVDPASSVKNEDIPLPRRAARNAEQALSGWVDTMPNELATAEEAQTLRQSCLRDAMTDLRHWADQNGVDFHQAMDVSGEAYLESAGWGELGRSGCLPAGHPRPPVAALASGFMDPSRSSIGGHGGRGDGPERKDEPHPRPGPDEAEEQNAGGQHDDRKPSPAAGTCTRYGCRRDGVRRAGGWRLSRMNHLGI